MSRKATDTYTASVTRLKALVGKLENAQVDVDELEAVVRESVDLVTVCRARLRATQASVDSLLAGLQDDAVGPAPQPPPAAPVPAPTSVSAQVSGGGVSRPAPILAPAKTVAPSFATDDDYDPFAED